MTFFFEESGQIDDFEVKLADKKVFVSTCKLSQDQVTEIVKKCGKDVKFIGTTTTPRWKHAVTSKTSIVYFWRNTTPIEMLQ